MGYWQRLTFCELLVLRFRERPYIRLLTIAFFALLAHTLEARASETNLWEEMTPPDLGVNAKAAWLQPQLFRAFRLRHDALAPLLRRAPKESATSAQSSESIIVLPMPDGTQSAYRFVEAPVMAPALAQKFPGLRTFVGQGLDDPAERVRFDVTPFGFHAQILSPRGAVYIDPLLRGDTNLHAVFYKRDYTRAADNFHCDTREEPAVRPLGPKAPNEGTQGQYPHTYRFACAATAQYTSFFGGAVAHGLAAIVTAVNRVNGIYETELGIRLELVPDEDRLIYTNAEKQPYSNADATSLLSQNQSNLDAIIGDENYDLGQVLGTAAGGLSFVGVVGLSGYKARGETGVYPPTGDSFFVDYVAHEIGHEFGAFHVFNSSEEDCSGGSRYGPSAYEPGSGSTLMSYAGLCGGDNLQAHSDPYYHFSSLEQIRSCLARNFGAAGSCPAGSAPSIPLLSVAAPPSYTIPQGTPFILTAMANAPQEKKLTYCWEERDLGPAVPLGSPDNGLSPLFRSFPPTQSPARAFPRWQEILGKAHTLGEQLPETSRMLNFRVTVRDGEGNLSSADTQIIVTSNAWPFAVTSPARHAKCSGTATVTWNVAGTDLLPINAANVNIWLSIDGGESFPLVLATNVPNSGACHVWLPNLATSKARVKIQPVNNIFFAVSPGNFTIQRSRAALGLGLGRVPVKVYGLSSTGVEGRETNLRLASDNQAPVPFLQPASSPDGAMRITWNCIPGQTYQVQFKNSLSDAAWQNLLPPLTATSGIATIEDTLSPSGQRFYRVVTGR